MTSAEKWNLKFDNSFPASYVSGFQEFLKAQLIQWETSTNVIGKKVLVVSAAKQDYSTIEPPGALSAILVVVGLNPGTPHPDVESPWIMHLPIQYLITPARNEIFTSWMIMKWQQSRPNEPRCDIQRQIQTILQAMKAERLRFFKEITSVIYQQSTDSHYSRTMAEMSSPQSLSSGTTSAQYYSPAPVVSRPKKVLGLFFHETSISAVRATAIAGQLQTLIQSLASDLEIKVFTSAAQVKTAPPVDCALVFVLGVISRYVDGPGLLAIWETLHMQKPSIKAIRLVSLYQNAQRGPVAEWSEPFISSNPFHWYCSESAGFSGTSDDQRRALAKMEQELKAILNMI